MKKNLRTFLLLAGWAVGLLVWAGVPRSMETRNPNYNIMGVTKVVILRPYVQSFLGGMAIAASAALFFTAIFLFAKRKILLGLSSLALLMVGGVAALFAYLFVFNIAPWIICSQTVGADKNQYYFINSSFLQGRRIALARLKEKSWFTLTLEVLGTTGGDSRWASVIRSKEESQEGAGRLSWSYNRKTLLGLYYDNHCSMAYELENKKFIGRDDIESLSPFICLGPATVPNLKDVEAIMKIVREKSPERVGYPQGLIEGLKHPNPEVIKITEQLIDIENRKRENAPLAPE